jgi:hypothetical protein
MYRIPVFIALVVVVLAIRHSVCLSYDGVLSHLQNAIRVGGALICCDVLGTECPCSGLEAGEIQSFFRM